MLGGQAVEENGGLRFYFAFFEQTSMPPYYLGRHGRLRLKNPTEADLSTFEKLPTLASDDFRDVRAPRLRKDGLEMFFSMDAENIPRQVFVSTPRRDEPVWDGTLATHVRSTAPPSLSMTPAWSAAVQIAESEV